MAVFNCSCLSQPIRNILRTAPFARTPEELQTLSQLVGRLKCFQKYAMLNRMDLARILHYDCFVAGSRVLRQGGLLLCVGAKGG